MAAVVWQAGICLLLSPTCACATWCESSDASDVFVHVHAPFELFNDGSTLRRCHCSLTERQAATTARCQFVIYPMQTVLRFY